MLFDESNYRNRLKTVVDEFKEDLKGIKTGRASNDMLSNINVEAYGQTMPLHAVAKIQIINATRIDIEVWDTGVLANVEKSLRDSSLGSVSVAPGKKNLFIINISPLTMEDREKKAAEIEKWLEERKIKLRLIRGEFKVQVESMEKVPEDDQKRSKEKIDSILKEFEASITEVCKQKTDEVKSIN